MPFNNRNYRSLAPWTWPWPLLLFAVGQVRAYPTNNYRDLDICNHWNGRRHFLELGERGDLHARNVTTTAFRSTFYTPSLNNYNANERDHAAVVSDIWYQCNLELVTCAECVIRITFTHANFSKSCAASNGVPSKSPRCPCEHIQFSEPPYDSTISGQEFCGDGKVFRSQTRTLLIKLYYRATNGHVFSLQYFSERNVKIVSGSPVQSIVSGSSSSTKPGAQVISTPYFPMPYPRDYGIEHILTCEADNCHVRLDFTDFQLGLASTLEIFDSNGQMLDSYTGEHFRPPITVSSGKSLLLQFRGNSATGVGFRADVSFVAAKQLKEERIMPYTDCGGMVTGPGGAITMMNMLDNATDVRHFDCIWLIKPGNNYMMMKTHISLHVEEFFGMAARSDLSIRQGTTSDAPEIEHVVWPNNGLSKESTISPVLTGFYIRLRGVFGSSSKLAIVYSVFNYLNCYIGSEFLCDNNHCISVRLHCDGFDHCGDGSDEPESCEADWAHLQNDRRWYSHKPNYYFPKMEQYPDLKTATGIFIISTLGIFGVLSGWMVILYRMGVRARHQRELQSHLQTISEFLDRQEEERTPDEPPSYEAPPDYEEVIKISAEQTASSTTTTAAAAATSSANGQQCQLIQHQSHQHRHQHHQHRNPRRVRDCSCSRNTSCTIMSPLPRSNSLDRPSTSAAAMNTTDNASGATNMQELSNRMLMATALCGNTESIGTTGAERKSVGISTCPSSLSVGRELSASIASPTTSSYGGDGDGGASTTEDAYRTDTIRDDSLGISLTLGLSDMSKNTSSQRPRHQHHQHHHHQLQEDEEAPTITMDGDLDDASKCTSTSTGTGLTTQHTEQTYLKRSWIVVQRGTQNCRIQRLRHTFSSPEGFSNSEWQLPYVDCLSYGANMPYERSFLYNSNTSTLISELSRDPISSSMSIQPAVSSTLNDTDTSTLTVMPSVVSSIASLSGDSTSKLSARKESTPLRSQSFIVISPRRAGASLATRSSSADLTANVHEAPTSQQRSKIFLL